MVRLRRRASRATRSPRIDIALWDIKGKLLGASVLDLLGGPVHERLPAIASCHAHYEDIGDDGRGGPGVGRARAARASRSGFGKRGDARLGYEHDRDVEYMRRDARGARPRPVVIMIDCGWNVKWDVTTAVRRVQAFEEYDLDWIEEPLGAWDPEGYANLRSQDDQR